MADTEPRDAEEELQHLAARGQLIDVLTTQLGVDRSDAADALERDAAFGKLANRIIELEQDRATQATRHRDQLDYQQDQQDTMWKRLVTEKAWDYAQRYGWCDVVQSCLAEMGIELAEGELQATITATYEVRMKIPYNELPSLNERGSDYVREHFSIPSGAMTAYSDEQMFDPTTIEVREWRTTAPSPKP